MNRAKAFYEKTFSVSLQHLTSDGLEMWAWPMLTNAPGCTGALVKMEGKDSGVGGVIIYFPCDDCGALAEQAKANGASIQKQKTAIGQYGFISLVVDTEGNVIGLHSMK